MSVPGEHFYGHGPSSVYETSRAWPSEGRARQADCPAVLHLATVNGAAAKLTLKRLHQMETTRCLLRSRSLGRS